ncbi:MAG: metallophosphoesterase family protein [Acidilobaceae archaeon]
MNLPSVGKFKDILEDLINIMDSEESKGGYLTGFRRGGVIVLEYFNGPIAVIGDIHGDYNTLDKILGNLEELEVIGRGLVVFLGDYIDRGPPEGQIATLARLYDLKKQLGEKIILLRGNHEPPQGLDPYPHDYREALLEIYGSIGYDLYVHSRRFFDKLPHALIIRNHILALHGGPPTITEAIDPLEYLAWDRGGSLEEILWNDPSEFIEYKAPNPRGAGSLWGPRVTEYSLNLTKTRLIVRGHEATALGYKFNHKGKVLTLFSRLGAPYYNYAAAYLACEELEALVSNILRCLKTIS